MVGHGVMVPRDCGAATWAGLCLGSPRQLQEPQGHRGAGHGRDSLQTLRPDRAMHGTSTQSLDTAEMLPGGSADQGRGLFAISSYPPLPTSPTSPHFWAHSSLRPVFIVFDVIVNAIVFFIIF